MNKDRILKIIKDIDTAERVLASHVSWKNKHSFIFGLSIGTQIHECSLEFSWLDPHTGYEPEVTAYVQALVEFRNQELRPLLEALRS